MAPDAVPGIMFGYKLNPGDIWNGEFYFVALQEFANMDFSVWGTARDVSVQTVKEVWWDKTYLAEMSSGSKQCKRNQG